MFGMAFLIWLIAFLIGPIVFSVVIFMINEIFLSLFGYQNISDDLITFVIFMINKIFLSLFKDQNTSDNLIAFSQLALFVALVIVGMCWPWAAICTKRLHDTDTPGSYLLLMFVPFGQFWLMYKLGRPGTDGPNWFGEKPKNLWDKSLPSVLPNTASNDDKTKLNIQGNQNQNVLTTRFDYKTLLQYGYYNSTKSNGQTFIYSTIVGINPREFHTNLENLKINENLALVREPTNPNDSYAIKAVRKDGQRIGYINKELANNIQWYFNSSEFQPSAVVLQFNNNPNMGIIIEIQPPLPELTEANVFLSTFSQQAAEFYKTGDIKQATKVLGALVNQEPNNVNAWYGLALCLDDTEKKKYCLQKILQQCPSHEHALTMLSKINKTYKFCPYCSGKIDKTANYCGHCGKNLLF